MRVVAIAAVLLVALLSRRGRARYRPWSYAADSPWFGDSAYGGLS